MSPVTIFFLVLFAIVLLGTGSILINLYDNVKTSVFTSDNITDMASFHWWIGILSIMTGVVCMIFSIVSFKSSQIVSNIATAQTMLTPYIKMVD